MEPVIVPRSEHPISRKSIDPDAVKVLYRLQRAGFQAYLVGGGVRDLLLGRYPKDFDISTDAHPQEVKRLFRNCRLIGRRFRLAHVHFGAKIVEVSTFRKRSEPAPDEGPGDGVEEDILIRSDNTFGNAEEDALRRDFTINGLFYDIGSFAVIDYVDGLADLHTRTIRTIGAPDIRFREDPIRMIRAIKFAARLDFQIEPATWQAILDNHDEILKSAPPRVLEEIYRLLGGGSAERSFHLLHESGMLDILVPQLADFLESRHAEGGDQPDPGTPSPMSRWLAALDRLRAEDAPLTNAILVGALVGPMAFDQVGPGGSGQSARSPKDGAARAGDDLGEPGHDGDDFELSGETEDRIYDVLATLGVPRRDTERLFQTFRAMRRFSGQRNRKFSPRSFVSKNYFPETFLFLHLATEATGRSEEVLTRWRKLAEEAGLDGSIPAGTRRRRRRRRPRGDNAGPAFDDNSLIEDGLNTEFESNEELEVSAAEDPADHVAPSSVPTEVPERRRGRSRRETEVPAPAVEAAPIPPPAHHLDEEDEEDSQIRFLGWSDQPEILRDRPEAPPVTNPYARQGPGAGRRGGGFRRDGGGPRQGGGGYSGGGPRHGGGGQRHGGPRPPDGAPRPPGSGPRHQGSARPPGGGGPRYSGGGSGGGQNSGRGGFGGPGRGNPTGGPPDSGFNPPDRGGQGRGGQGGGSGQGRGGWGGGRPQGGGTSGPPGGQSGRRPRRRQRRRED